MTDEPMYVISESQLKGAMLESLDNEDVRSIRSHTLSSAIAEYNRGVVAELERLSNQNVGIQYRYALTEAISLIRDGVKK